MDRKISVLLADDNAELCGMLSEYINSSSDITTKGIAGDGLEAVKMIESMEPDVVVLDLIMPGLDGIGVLERINSLYLKRKPIFIILTAIGQEMFIDKVIELGAEYYMIKPFDMEVLVMRIRQLYNEIYAQQQLAAAIPTEPVKQPGRDKDLRTVVTLLMQKMGVAPNLAGYCYLREIITLSFEKPEIGLSTKQLYPIVAETHGTTARKVDRAIRSAVENAARVSRSLDENEGNLLTEFIKTKPANGKIIAMLAEKARMEMEMK